MREAQYSAYVQLLKEKFGVTSAPCAKAYVRDPSVFAGMEVNRIASQIIKVRTACAEHNIRFFSQPRTLSAENLRSYLNADWDGLIDKRSRCGFPWAYAEISARGDVTTCHTFYDLTIGNIYNQSLLEIWRGQQLKAVQAYLREGLFPICTACSRYHTGFSPIAAPQSKREPRS